MSVATIFYHLAVALWVGGLAIFTFVVTPIIFKTQSRDMAGQIVGAIFPAYFRWGLACGAIALVTHLMLCGTGQKRVLVVLLLMLALTSFQAFYIEPRAAELKRQITSFETTPKDHPLRREFSKLHGMSAVCNLSVFGGGVLLVILL